MCKTILILLSLCIISKVKANCTESCCETKGKATAGLDLAIQMMKDVRDNYPDCTSNCLPMDCEDILQNGQNKSGIYEVWPRSRVLIGPIKVYCEMDTDGVGWTVIQRRGNYGRPKDFFYQDWKSYKDGFGYVDQDFWLGNDNIFRLSNQRLYSARFDLQDVEGNRRYALYDTFWIDDEDHQYTLHIKGFSGDVGDSMKTHDGQKFTTKDRKNDNRPPRENCAQTFKGGWWYNKCHEANLNGLYHRGKHDSYGDGVNWYSWKNYHESLESTEIKLRGI